MLTEGRRLWLFYSRSSRKCKYFDGLRGVVRYSPGGDIVMATSDTNGKTWSSPQVSQRWILILPELHHIPMANADQTKGHSSKEDCTIADFLYQRVIRF